MLEENEAKKQKTLHDFVEVNSMDKEIAELACVDGFSFKSIANSKFIQKSFQKFKYDKKIPTSDFGVKSCMMRYFEMKKKELASYFQCEVAKGERFSVTLDEYTSKQNRRYSNVNIHSKDSFWNLGLIRIVGKFDSFTAIKTVSDRLAMFNLNMERDIVACTTDGASVMLKFGQNIAPFHQQCMAHGINLSICDALYKNTPISFNDEEEENDDDEEEEATDSTLVFETSEHQPEIRNDYNILINKVRKICKTFRKSPLKNDCLQSEVKKMNNNLTLNLILDTKTRWNSLLHMLERALKLKNCISEAFKLLGLEESLTEMEWEEVRNIVNVLKPLEIVIKELSTRDSSLLKAESSFIFIMNQIKGKDRLSVTLRKSLKERFLDRRQKDVVSLLRYLHNPTTEVSEFPTSTKQMLKKFAELTYNRLFPEGCLGDEEIEEVEEEIGTNVTSLNEGDLLKQFYSEFDKITASAKNELRSFDSTKEFKLFEATKQRSAKLDRLCSALMTIKPTSVESERAFSMAGLFVSKIRSKLSDNTLDAQVFLKAYLSNKN